MFATEHPFVLLESRVGQDAGGRLFARPHEIVSCDDLDQWDETLQRIAEAPARDLHAAGYLAYEVGQAVEPLFGAGGRLTPPTPLAWFGLFEAPAEIAARDLDSLFAALAPPAPLREIALGHTREEHVAKVAAIQALIQAGDLYQANLTFPIRFRYEGHAPSLYAALRAAQPVSRGALIWTGGQWLLSVSPELFFEVRESVITARPMKGTSARGADADADREAKLELAADPKQRAENLMITDLLRNDLSRIAVAGSVRTPALFTIETYPTFHGMTSTVTGAISEGVGPAEVLSALFPCGSVVGAPKIRASQVIAELETAPRGPYCGAIGSLSPTGEMSFNVAIRTAVLEVGGAGSYGVGGGIVADSQPDEEFEEALLKARVLTDLAKPFELIETFRWDPASGFIRLERHLDRLSRSAAALGFACELSDLLQELAQSSATWSSATPMRTRLALRPCGSVSVDATPLEEATDRPLRIVIDDEPLDCADPFLRHKTSRRAGHEQAFLRATAAGCGEAILLNRAGQIADGARSTVFVERNGRLLTPSVAAGALPGVLRAALIEEGRAVEANLTPADLENAIFVGSSLRGLRRAGLV